MMKKPILLIIATLLCSFSVAAMAQTNWTGAVNTDINNAGNWDNGLPTNTGANDGTVPTGFPGLTGSPQNKNITFEGDSGFVGNNFGGAQANGYNVVFNGTGNADFTGNGLFLAWDGGAANTSSFEWNSTGTADTTRFFLSRFGAGTFTQSAGTINQNATGAFEMIGGEFTPGVTWTMSGGTLNSAASEFEVRFGSLNQSGGTINANTIKWDEGGATSFTWDFSGGTVVAQNMTGFNATDRLNFSADGTGVFNILNSNLDVAAAEALITDGWITKGGAASTPADFNIAVVDIDGSSYTEISTGPSTSFAITDISISPDEMITLTWNSRPGKSYSVNFNTDLVDWGADITDGVPSGGETTIFGPFPNPFDADGIAPFDPLPPKIFFRVMEN